MDKERNKSFDLSLTIENFQTDKQSTYLITFENKCHKTLFAIYFPIF